MSVPGILSAAELRATAESIAAQQLSDGAIPWFLGEHLDPWDHVESAMALTAAGLREEAAWAYQYSAGTQQPDGSWPMRTLDGVVTSPLADTNQCAYIAVGLWHYWLATSDRQLIAQLWPTVHSAIQFVLRQQRQAGDIAWAVDADGQVAAESLLAGNSSIYQALRCAGELADLVGAPEPDWELATVQLGHALAKHRELFADKSRFAMDWYYPVLTGAVVGDLAALEIQRRWQDFVEPRWGIRCVSDQPWVTGAETCELVLALDAVGQRSRALGLFGDIQHLRHEDGSYWTGHVIPDNAIWPVERSTWTAAAVVLAADALSRTSDANGLFRGDRLRPQPRSKPGSCACVIVERV